MFLNRNQRGYGWYSKVVSKDLNTNAERLGYINFTFKKGCEPTNLNEKGSYEGELYFIDKQGNKRKAFPIVNEYNGLTRIDFKLLEVEDTSNFGGDRSDSVKSLNLEPNDLPFYWEVNKWQC